MSTTIGDRRISCRSPVSLEPVAPEVLPFEIGNTLTANKIIADLLATPEFDKLVAYHSNVVVKTDLAKDLLNVSGSPVHLEKTVLNLVSNEVEAGTK